MNPVADEIKRYLGSASMSDEEFLEHYGMPRRSGRYPWGSGENPYQRTGDFLARVEQLKKEGWEETTENIKKEFGMNSTQYRREKRLCINERKMDDIATAKRLQEKEGLTPTQIGRKMGVNESTVRGWLKEDHQRRVSEAQKTADFLKEQVNKKGMIDVGRNVERELGVSKEKLDTALYILEREGYHVYKGGVPQPTNKNQQTNMKVLTKPEGKHRDIYDYEKIKTVTDYVSKDNGDSYEKKFTYPSSLDSKRLQIRYDEDGGTLNDGLVELRRGVQDLNLGDGKRYSQVRILVDGTHYIKGMAVYSDDLPDGVDVRFNTNKTRAKCPNKKDVLKPIKDDPENPFGSAIKDADQGGQYWYTDKNGKKKLGLINKTRDEGDWTEWKDSLPSQFLSKQSKNMAKKQLDLAKAERKAELDEIMSLTNPTVKKYYLDKFADKCDAAAVDLKAAALPGQKYHVIVPNGTLKDNEIYAPGYKDGTKLALVRYPHGGTFEIPICTVNNKNARGQQLIGRDSIDAVCINSNVASRLSGADFDGDTVMCIPTHDRMGKVKITTKDPNSPGLKSLIGFDPKTYKADEVRVDKNGKEHYYRNGREFKTMKRTDLEMGKISNLITDMTLHGAPDAEIARAVKHSMVVIDAEKHKLDYTQSYKENNIAQLKKKWQVKKDPDTGEIIGYGGASTIVSKAKSPQDVLKRKGEPKVNQKGKSWYDPNKPEGSLIYTTAPDRDVYYADGKYDKKTGIKTLITVDGKTVSYSMNNKTARDKYEPVMSKNKKTGDIIFKSKDGSITYRTRARTDESTKMAEADDAMKLVSSKRHPMELLYADYANSMKALANKARIEKINTGNLTYNKKAKEIYKNEVASLEAHLNDALKNSVRERHATRLAAAKIKEKKEAEPNIKKDDLQKYSQRTMAKYREEVGSKSRRKRNIEITDKEWEAIQAGAISENKLKQILANSDPDILREKAMPKDNRKISSAQISRIKAMSASNFTIKEIAEKLGLSTSAVSKCLRGVK